MTFLQSFRSLGRVVTAASGLVVVSAAFGLSLLGWRSSSEPMPQVRLSDLRQSVPVPTVAELLPKPMLLPATEQFLNNGPSKVPGEYAVNQEMDSSFGPETVAGHWAYEPLAPPVVPAVQQTTWPRNRLDDFVLHTIEQADLPAPNQAPSEQLVRRITLSTIGVPPSPELLSRYKNATAAQLDELVEQLLADPRFGEHWASFWLDLVRYADTNGYEDDGIKPLAWQYRDFVIRAFNADVPYDQFIKMQLAGDLVSQPTADDFIAAGFLRLGPWDSEPGDLLQGRYDDLAEIASTTAAVFLGLTAGCAQCHDHPTEPIESADFYRLVGLFHGLSRPTTGRQEKPTDSATPQQLTQAAQAFKVQRQLIRHAGQADQQIGEQLRHQAAELTAPFQFEQAYRFQETLFTPVPLPILHRGQVTIPDEQVWPGVPAILATTTWDAKQPPRLAFANWLVTEQQALTARLLVNRVWSWHFGQGLVDTTENLGLSGSEPNDPHLLNWLAHWFVTEANWSLKRLHRLILTSATFRSRRLSPSEFSTATKDRPVGSLFGLRRLRAEQLHDSLLAVSGQLSPNMFGPPVIPAMPPERLASLPEAGHWRTPDPPGQRAIYYLVSRNLPLPLLGQFDFAIASEPCTRRSSQQTPQQALQLWNSEFVNRCAERMAARIKRETDGSLDHQIHFACQLVWSRNASQQELTQFREFLADDLNSETTSTHSADGHHHIQAQRWQELCLVLLNTNEFLYLP